jgi:hypothetical protein
MSEADRLRFSLKNLNSSDWEAFEQLASAYLAQEFPELRTIAGVGDGGRDAVFFGPVEGVVVQYSIQADWEQKIRRTLARLREQAIPCHFLIYASNQQIGARVDKIRAELLLQGIALDVRDITYFVDRVYVSDATKAAAESLGKRIVDPLLPANQLARNSPVTDAEMRAGLVYLELHLRDSRQSRDLTKISYESLALGALIDSTPEEMRSRADVVTAVQRQIPGQHADQVETFTGQALKSLQEERMVIVKGPPEDRFYALHHRERSRQTNRAIEIIVEREAVREELQQLLQATAAALEVELGDAEQVLTSLADALDRMLQSVLEQEGHRFVDAVRTQSARFDRSDLLPIAERAVASSEALGDLGAGRDEMVELLLDGALQAFTSPPGMVRAYLRDLSDAYTLLAFMRETPDVQKAVAHFFSRGTLVLDASVLLPCFAETLVPTEGQRFTNLLRSAKEAGMNLRATAGVANEIDTHLRRALFCFRTPPSEWEGEVPFALEHWHELSGGGDFAEYIYEFVGRNGPDDIQQFLEHGLEISPIDLEEEAESALAETERYEFTELWRTRKRIRQGGDATERDLLLRHDLEMYLGVLARRKSERKDVFGYESWWVTRDRVAQRIFGTARKAKLGINSDPCMSPAFLSNLLSIGPARTRLGEHKNLLPVALEIQRRGWPDMELTSVANQIREKHAEDPEWRIRQRIRQAMNTIKESTKEEMPNRAASTA